MRLDLSKLVFAIQKEALSIHVDCEAILLNDEKFIGRRENEALRTVTQVSWEHNRFKVNNTGEN